MGKDFKQRQKEAAAYLKKTPGKVTWFQVPCPHCKLDNGIAVGMPKDFKDRYWEIKCGAVVKKADAGKGCGKEMAVISRSLVFSSFTLAQLEAGEKEKPQSNLILPGPVAP